MDITTRRGFLNLAAAFEGATLLLGLLVGWLSGAFTPQSLRVNMQDVLWGVAAVVPMLSILLFARGLRRQVLEMLGASLASCRWYDLAALAVLAGLGEELLFRGALEPWMARWNPWIALFAVNVLFGLAHAVSKVYFLFALVIGLYFSLLLRGWEGLPGTLSEANLLRPVVAHGVYDFIAFQFIVRDYRRSAGTPPPDSTSVG